MSFREDMPVGYAGLIDQTGVDHYFETVKTAATKATDRVFYEIGGLVKAVVVPINDITSVGEDGRGSMDAKKFTELMCALREVQQKCLWRKKEIAEDAVLVMLCSDLPAEGEKLNEILKKRVETVKKMDDKKKTDDQKKTGVVLSASVKELGPTDPEPYCFIMVTEKSIDIDVRHLISNFNPFVEPMPMELLCSDGGFAKEDFAAEVANVPEFVIQECKRAAGKRKLNANVEYAKLRMRDLQELKIDLGLTEEELKAKMDAKATVEASVLKKVYDQLQPMMKTHDEERAPKKLKKCGGVVPIDTKFFNATAGTDVFNQITLVAKDGSYYPQCAVLPDLETEIGNVPYNVGVMAAIFIWMQKSDKYMQILGWMMCEWGVEVCECNMVDDTTWNGGVEIGAYNNPFGITFSKEQKYKNHFGLGMELGAQMVKKQRESGDSDEAVSVRLASAAVSARTASAVVCARTGSAEEEEEEDAAAVAGEGGDVYVKAAKRVVEMVITPKLEKFWA